MQKMLTRMQRLDELIRIKGTGSPAQLAERVGLSERSIYEYLKIMKTCGAPIQYSRSRKSYCYEYDGMFTISFITTS